MALTNYELLVGTDATDLQNKVRAKQATGSVIVYNMFQRGGYYCQGVGTGTVDLGTLSMYQLVSSPNITTFAAMVSGMLPNAQPVGTPVVYNSALFQVMGVVQPYNMTGQNGSNGKSPQLQVANDYVQWKYETDMTWNNLIALSSITGASADMRVNNNAIQWKHSSETAWTTLVGLDTLTGPAGPANTLSVGTVTTGAAGSNASATITGTAPAQTLALTVPRGNAGTNSVTETITGTVVTAGTAVPLTFTKTYSAPPTVIPIPNWNGTQLITGAAAAVTATGCTFLAMQSRGTLLLTSGPFENAAAGQTFRVLVIGN